MKATAPCACGAAPGAMIKLGWRATATGDVVELARCGACLVAIPIRVMADASICAGCHRVVTGEADDPKACADRGGVSEVLCRACARRMHGVPKPAIWRNVANRGPDNGCAARDFVDGCRQRNTSRARGKNVHKRRRSALDE